MRAEDRDNAYLWDMREAAKEVAEFTQDATYEEFTSKKPLRYAVERLLMVEARLRDTFPIPSGTPTRKSLGAASSASATCLHTSTAR